MNSGPVEVVDRRRTDRDTGYMTNQLRDIRSIPMQDNEAGADTVGEYLALLLTEVWAHEGAFSGKRPFGNSDWKYEVYESLVTAGVVTGEFEDESGYYLLDFDRLTADALVFEAIRLMGVPA